jgi:hypothetical protein
VDQETLAASVHRRLECLDCHADAGDQPHQQRLGPASCGGRCHLQANVDYRRSIHAEAAVTTGSQSPTCSACHGVHRILSHRDRDSPVHASRVAGTCAKCHQHASGDSAADSPPIQTSTDAIHHPLYGRGYPRLSITCVNCHQSHAVRPVADPESPAHRDRMITTCAECHAALVATYRQSVHGDGGKNEAPAVVVCIECHPVHKAARIAPASIEAILVRDCGFCHADSTDPKSDRYRGYMGTAHGRIEPSGELVARCVDCHGVHSITKVDDKDSPLQSVRRVEVCRRCHENDAQVLVVYAAHAIYTRVQIPLVIGGLVPGIRNLLSAALVFFVLHALLWHRRLSKSSSKPGVGLCMQTPYWYVKMLQLTYQFTAVFFIAVLLSCLPFVYDDFLVARLLMGMIGGRSVLVIIHSVIGSILVLGLAIHLIQMHPWSGWLSGPWSMLPRWQDVQDVWHVGRWLIGGDKPPVFDHPMYWCKFDFWVSLGLIALIGSTGVIQLMLLTSSDQPSHTLAAYAGALHGNDVAMLILFALAIRLINASLTLDCQTS